MTEVGRFPRCRSLLAGGAALGARRRGGARAQSFPSGPVKIVTSVGAGSSPDVCARVLADHLTRLWGQQVIVLNQPGGAGAVAIKAVAPAAPDGHTLYMSLATNFIALPELQTNFPVDVLRDFVPIGYVGDHPMVIAAGRDLGVNTLPELIALAKKRKGELNIAAGNRGSILHLAGEWLRTATGIEVTLVHYPSASQAITDILGGRVHAMIDAVPAMRGAIEGGQLKALAVATETAAAEFPEPADGGRDHPGLRGGRLAGADGAARHARAAGAQDQRRPARRAGPARIPEALRGPRHLHPPDHARGARPRSSASSSRIWRPGDRRDREEDQVIGRDDAICCWA